MSINSEYIFRLNGYDESNIDKELESYKKVGGSVSPELTTRLKHTIVSVNGDDSKAIIFNFLNINISLKLFALHIIRKLPHAIPEFFIPSLLSSWYYHFGNVSYTVSSGSRLKYR